MDYLVQIIDSLAWPIIILIIILIFKSEFSKVVSQLSNLKYRDFEAKFGNQLQEAENKLKEIKKPESFDIPEEESKADITEDNDYERLLRLAEISPRAAISEAWIQIESAAKTAASQAGLNVRKPESVINIVKAFIKNGIFDEMNLEAFDVLRSLRNNAIHTPDFYIPQDETEKYIDLALRLAFELLNTGNILAEANKNSN